MQLTYFKKSFHPHVHVKLQYLSFLNVISHSYIRITQILQKDDWRSITRNFLFAISAHSSIAPKRSPYNGFHFPFVSRLLTLQYLSSRRALIILRIVARAVCMLVNSPRFSANFAAASQTRFSPFFAAKSPRDTPLFQL